MKKITNPEVKFVADRLATLQDRVAQPVKIGTEEDFIRETDGDILNINGKDREEFVSAALRIVEQYRPAASAYLMRQFTRAGRITAAIAAGRLSGHSAYNVDGVVKLQASYSHVETKRALFRFVRPKIQALLDAENKKRETELADYIARISGEIIPPDPEQEKAETAGGTAAPEIVLPSEEKKESTVELPADLED